MKLSLTFTGSQHLQKHKFKEKKEVFRLCSGKPKGWLPKHWLKSEKLKQ